MNSQPAFKFFNLNFHVLENFVEQPRPDDFTGMNRNNGSSSVGMPEKMMAAFDAQNDETRVAQRRQHFTSAKSGQTRHNQTAMRWTPMNSLDVTDSLSTSRHNWMASRMRSISLSSDRACVWQPGNAGTLAT